MHNKHPVHVIAFCQARCKLTLRKKHGKFDLVGECTIHKFQHYLSLLELGVVIYRGTDKV